MTPSAETPLVEGWRQLCRAMVAASFREELTKAAARYMVGQVVVDLVALGPLGAFLGRGLEPSATLRAAGYADGGPVSAEVIRGARL
jgi:hypothetical protein